MIGLITFILAINSVVPGGRDNDITASYSFAYGNDVDVTTPYTAAFFSEGHPGKVGINEPNPTEALHVNGNAKVDGNAEVNGTVRITDVLILTPRASAPIPPEEGMIYVNSTDNHIWCYIDGDWRRLDNE